MIGEVIRRRYKIIAEIGKDKAGISETYLAEDLDMPVNPKPKRVVKCLQPQIINDDIRRLFNKEADILYKLGEKSDRIPTLYAFFEEEGRFYIVQEYIDGNDLSDELTPGTKWDEAKVINFLQEMLEILAFVHANNVIHRDIKPQNIMRRKDSRLVFIDFGAIKEIATRPIDSSTTPFTFSIGTPDYIPIEQFRGKPEFSSDIYALGITAIQALTGLIPKPSNWRDSVLISDTLAQIVTKMVRDNIEERYQSSQDILNALSLISSKSSSPVNYRSNNNFVPNSNKKVYPKPLKIGDKYGYIDQTGKVVIKPKFTFAQIFSDGLASVVNKSYYCFIDVNGKTILKTRYHYIDLPTSDVPTSLVRNNRDSYLFKSFFVNNFSGDYAHVKQGIRKEGFSWLGSLIHECHFFINKNGQKINKKDFEDAGSFHEGLAAVMLNGKWGYINKTGEFAIAPKFDEAALQFTEGLAWVKIGNKFGFIDKQGQIVIKPRFDYAWYFSEGLAPVTIKKNYINFGDWGYINQQGEIIIKPNLDLDKLHRYNDYCYFNENRLWKASFSEGLACVKGLESELEDSLDDRILNNLCKKYGYIDKTGKFVIERQFSSAEGFREGLAAVKIDGKWGYIDKTGTIVIEPQFKEAYAFNDEMALVKIGEEEHYIDRQGKIIEIYWD